MLGYNWDFSFIPSYSDVVLQAVVVTIELSLLSIVLTTLLGTLVGILLSRPSKEVRIATTLVVDIIRSIPLLVLILFIYYLFPALGFRSVEAFWAALIAIVVNHSAFFGDIIRGSLEGVPKGLMLSARSLGFSKKDALLRILLPEVYRETLPAITLLYISIVKMTSLASVIAVYEITHVGDWITSSTYKPLEVYTLIAGLYLVIVLPLTLISRRIEKSSYFKRRTV